MPESTYQMAPYQIKFFTDRPEQATIYIKGSKLGETDAVRGGLAFLKEGEPSRPPDRGADGYLYLFFPSSSFADIYSLLRRYNAVTIQWYVPATQPQYAELEWSW